MLASRFAHCDSGLVITMLTILLGWEGGGYPQRLELKTREL